MGSSIKESQEDGSDRWVEVEDFQKSALERDVFVAVMK